MPNPLNGDVHVVIVGDKSLDLWGIGFLGRPLTAEGYPLLMRLAATGIRGLYQMAVQDFGFAPQRGAYLNHCDLCDEIRGALIQVDGGRFRELAPAGYYNEGN